MVCVVTRNTKSLCESKDLRGARECIVPRDISGYFRTLLALIWPWKHTFAERVVRKPTASTWTVSVYTLLYLNNRLCPIKNNLKYSGITWIMNAEVKGLTVISFFMGLLLLFWDNG